jgi:hypothetical protein
MSKECRYCGFVAEWANKSCWCGALSNPERKPTHPENMKKEEKIIQLLEMIVKQNEEIIKNQNIWRTFPTVPVPPSIDPHFGKDIPYVPYKGPDCEVRTTTPIYTTSYDGTKTTLPVNTLPDNE